MKSGKRDYKGVSMMAGHWSSYTHQKVYEVLNKYINRKAQVLDIGAGQGAFSSRLQQEGHNVVALEGFAEFEVEGVSLHKVDLNGSWPKNIGEPFDIAIGIEIIEHVQCPYHFMEEAFQKLKKNGYMILSTPNPFHLQARLQYFLKGKVQMLQHPDHRTPIFFQLMEKMAQETGFNIVEHTYDINPLTVQGKTLKGKMLRPLARLVSKLITPPKHRGNSNIWVLQPSKQ